MSTPAADISKLAEALQARIQEQNIIAESSSNSASEDEKTKLATAKDATKQALFALLRAVSGAPKDELSPERRQFLDDTVLMKHAATLKWPLLRSLEDPCHYRALLGLPNTREQARRFLTTASASKLDEILATKLSSNITICDNSQCLVWVEHVLQYMTGDGRRKKDLGGFVLQGPQKNAVRAALNKAKKRRQELESASNSSNATQEASTSTKHPIEHTLERDVRIADKERQEARAQDFSSLVDEAFLKKEKNGS